VRKVDESLFGVLRVITIMIQVEGGARAEEINWFKHIMKTCDLDPD